MSTAILTETAFTQSKANIIYNTKEVLNLAWCATNQAKSTVSIAMQARSFAGQSGLANPPPYSMLQSHENNVKHDGKSRL